ncbi:MAG: hypothetical protein ACYC2H_13030 [Thermoplasmatota archaeon]
MSSRQSKDGLRPTSLAGLLMACAGALTGLALASPSPMTVANAILFWAWAVTAMRFARLHKGQRICAACGAVDPPRLPDESCAACASPLRKSFPDLAKAAEQEHQAHKALDPPSTSW